MNKYQVKSVDGKYTIEADSWSVGDEGLKFYQYALLKPCGEGNEDKTEYQRWVVAWFTSWDYWMLEDVYD